ncbi:hypothetical protein BKA70DRAFT_1143189, partial [Coprinopsis sp. MPI-PUGE-AT-0042]
MSHSTVSSSTYIISKYSKASAAKKPQNQQQQPEWQHFTNPVLKVVLDKTKAQDGQIESLRLRIIWTLGDEDDTMSVSGQTPVVFEDMDLISFSDTSKYKLQRQAAEGLPLKAVYRDSVVCVRFLHLQTQAYRRFQISFRSLADTTNFVNAIKTACPCKLLPGPPNAPNTAGTSTNAPRQPSRTVSPMLNRAPSMLPNAFDTPNPGRALPRSATMAPPSQLPRYNSAAIDMNFDGGFAAADAPDPAFALMANPPVSAMGPPSFIPTLKKPAARSMERTSSAFPLSQDLAFPDVHTYHQHSSQGFPSSSQLPPSSSPPPSSAGQSQQPELQNSRSQTPSNQAGAALMASLRDATALYGMSTETLEQAIGEIVREDGFVRLMEKLDSMWRIRALAG